MMKVRQYQMIAGRRSPLVVEPVAPGEELPAWITAQGTLISEQLAEYGAVLFRGFRVERIEDFERFVAAVTPDRMDYVYGSTPRTSIGDRIFTATEYPPAQEIPLHNENAYQREWPMALALCCQVVAQSGGETPIADMKAVTAAIGNELMDKFERNGVRYVRHYRPFVDVPWQKVFKTEDRSALASFCAQQGIEHEWLDQETLRTAQVCQGTARHPQTGQRVFFNQAHLFHVSSLGAAARSMIEVFGADRLPRQTYFGNGEEIPAEVLAAVRSAFVQSQLTFPWHAGDVMLLDNMQFAHGRRPYKGARKVVVALMNAYSPAQR